MTDNGSKENSSEFCDLRLIDVCFLGILDTKKPFSFENGLFKFDFIVGRLFALEHNLSDKQGSIVLLRSDAVSIMRDPCWIVSSLYD